MKLNFNLKNRVNEEELIIASIVYKGKRMRFSTKQKAFTKAWNSKTQRCNISSEFQDRINRDSRKVNKFLETLAGYLDNFYRNDEYLDNEKHVRSIFESYLVTLKYDGIKEEKQKQIKPLEFFEKFIKEKRINKASGTYINERTVQHHAIVLKRFKMFFRDKYFIEDFSIFNKNFESTFEKWCIETKGYSANTIPASLSILKVWLNAATKEGLTTNSDYLHYKAKTKEVDNIYLNEDEITRIYNLDIESLKANGEIDKKSKIEVTRDLFIIGCWTGLRLSDLNKLNETAIFNFEEDCVSIITEKTHEQVIIPLHQYVKEIYEKYNGSFPRMIVKDKSIAHLKELGRFAKIEEFVDIKTFKAGKYEIQRYKKYQLIKNHTARRSFATNLYLRGATTINIMKLTGHTTEANFMKYIKITKKENMDIMRKFFN